MHVKKPSSWAVLGLEQRTAIAAGHSLSLTKVDVFLDLSFLGHAILFECPNVAVMCCRGKDEYTPQPVKPTHCKSFNI